MFATSSHRRTRRPLQKPRLARHTNCSTGSRHVAATDWPPPVDATDDAAGARALDTWVAFHVSYVIDAQYRTGSQFITVPAGILDELAELAAVAFRLGPQSGQSACAAFDDLVTGERGYVTRQLTDAQTWSAVITRVAAGSGDRPPPEWWKNESFPTRVAQRRRWIAASGRPHHGGRIIGCSLCDSPHPEHPRLTTPAGSLPPILT